MRIAARWGRALVSANCGISYFLFDEPLFNQLEGMATSVRLMGKPKLLGLGQSALVKQVSKSVAS